MDRLYQARKSYQAAFGDEGPRPDGVSDEDLAESLEQAVDAGTRIGADRDWRRDRETNPERDG